MKVCQMVCCRPVHPKILLNKTGRAGPKVRQAGPGRAVNLWPAQAVL